jgi:hypothetical protein
VAVSHALAAPSAGVYRVARGANPFVFRRSTRIPLNDGAVEDGNRWDDPDGLFKTLYCASSPEAAFGETIARYREAPGLLDRISAFLTSEPDPAYDFELIPGSVPDDYFQSRYIGHISVDQDARFVDLDHPHTHTASRPALKRLLTRFEVSKIDRGTFLNPDRRITQTIAQHYWQLSLRPDHQNWRGLRYVSRLAHDWECWAVWQPSPLRQLTANVKVVTRNNPALISAAERLGIRY